ncbi:rhodanese-like domain-containing protein [Microbacterium sp. NPDC076911]|uniref:rhodanese-like domain-containing protein n=1 Tax=Microbacterium sp. NPDC076911 TaxID=3154958 RepID=UPI00342E2F12
MRRSIPLAISAIFLTLGLAACTSTTSASDATPELSDDTIILDVRTQEEYDAGHLEGAQLLDFNGGEVAAAIPTLDPDAEYLVYCRSGNRAGQAIALMEEAGFSDLTNLGSLEDAAQTTSIEIVR